VKRMARKGKREVEIRLAEAGQWFAHHLDRRWMLDRLNQLTRAAEPVQRSKRRERV
jgi:hypothetical protein